MAMLFVESETNCNAKLHYRMPGDVPKKPKLQIEQWLIGWAEWEHTGMMKNQLSLIVRLLNYLPIWNLMFELHNP